MPSLYAPLFGLFQPVLVTFCVKSPLGVVFFCRLPGFADNFCHSAAGISPVARRAWPASGQGKPDHRQRQQRHRHANAGMVAPVDQHAAFFCQIHHDQVGNGAHQQQVAGKGADQRQGQPSLFCSLRFFDVRFSWNHRLTFRKCRTCGTRGYRVMRSRLRDSHTRISPERALEKLRRFQHQVVNVSDLEPLAGLSSSCQEY